MTYETLIDDLNEYCEQVGLKPSTVCVRAINDSRYVQRHQRRIELLQKDAEKIRAYMAAHPAAQPEDAQTERGAA